MLLLYYYSYTQVYLVVEFLLVTEDLEWGTTAVEPLNKSMKDLLCRLLYYSWIHPRSIWRLAGYC